MPTKIPQELKIRAIELVVDATNNGERVTTASRRIATELGLNPDSLRTWVRQHLQTGAETPQQSADLLAENRRLRAELAETRRANEILRKASAFLRRSSTAHIVSREIHRHPPPQLLCRVDRQSVEQQQHQGRSK